MSSIQEQLIVDLILKHNRTIHFEKGLMGTDTAQDFVLTVEDADAPLFWLQAVDMEEITFPVVDPYVICPEYAPEFSQKDLEELDLNSADELLALCLVTMVNLKNQKMTVNLAAPLLINWRKGIGRQCVLFNYKNYPSNYPMSSIKTR